MTRGKGSAATSDPHKPDDVFTNSEDHCIDEIRYACMSRPWIKSTTPYDGPVDPVGAPAVTRFKRDWKWLNEMTWGEFEREAGIELGKSKPRSDIRIR
jgi:hypothetical protein